VTSDLILRALPSTASAGVSRADEVPNRARRLKEDLAVATAFLSDVSHRAFEELEALSEPQVVATAQLLPVVVDKLRERFQDLALELRVSQVADIRLPGGDRSFERMLHNLVANAVEGDGTKGASRVWIRGEVRGATCCFTVEDDGPGFDDAARERGVGKRHGLGLGLDLTARLLASAGGQLTRSNRAEGGARVSLELPSVTGQPRPGSAPPADRSGAARSFAVPATDRGR
jgi:C4-dicarboxylate-specific signal transduction histidine kinase